jgi:hypothetical protein
MLDGCSSHVSRLFLLFLLLLRCTFYFFLSLPLLFSLPIHFLLLSLLFFLLVLFHLSCRFSSLIFLQNIIFSELLFRFLFMSRGQNFLLRQILKHLSHRINKSLFFHISISGCFVLCKELNIRYFDFEALHDESLLRCYEITVLNLFLV